MKINIFLKIGLIGLVVTALNHALISYVLDIDISAAWAYFIIWVVLILIGIGFTIGNLSKKKKSVTP